MQPPEDRDMELREHIAELRDRVIKGFAPFFLVLGLIFLKSDQVITYIWNDLFPGKEMVVYSPTEYMITRILASAFLSFFVTYPWIIYQIYLFMKPGLYPHERRFLKIFLPFSYLVFVLGVAFSYFVILPKLYSTTVVEYFGAEPYLSVRKSLQNSVKLALSVGLAFQIPVVAAIAAKLGLITSKWLRDKRLIIYIAVFILATNVSLDITGITQIIVLSAVVVMYEISILIAKLFEGGAK
ncbi:Twin arginine targeting {Tat} protein translocase TatC [Geoglobus ahangari]|uniref:Sec-independent protein translocase protein TatC n=1 Tax=Geoglobus ahangari TaxID=113653 RepID=A0A0F7IE80_9EURY|nr:twin-arginine translocase subunit TatC [Geoglobus ahangari]AKG91814.1 Twin arginine targeting {Tat} protein translocase TatC [Geoglobus ahangari]